MHEGSLDLLEPLDLVLQGQGDVVALHHCHLARQHDLHLHVDYT